MVAMAIGPPFTPISAALSMLTPSQVAETGAVLSQPPKSVTKSINGANPGLVVDVFLNSTLNVKVSPIKTSDGTLLATKVAFGVPCAMAKHETRRLSVIVQSTRQAEL